MPKQQKKTEYKMSKKNQKAATKASAHKSVSKPTRTLKPQREVQKDRVGRSAVVKFFATELSDDEERFDEHPSPPSYDFFFTPPMREESNKENMNNTQTEVYYNLV